MPTHLEQAAPPVLARSRRALLVSGYTVSLAMPLFRADLLQDRVIALAGSAEPGVRSGLERLGATVEMLEDGLDESAAEAWATRRAPLHALVCDARGAFDADGLEAAMDYTWSAVRAIAVGALIPQTGGKIVLVAPAPGVGPHDQAARAALENLARTLSVEWARHGITVTAVAPGARTSEAELAELVCFLASPAGDYFSGCRFEFGLIRGS